jgi:hypothetical protein
MIRDGVAMFLTEDVQILEVCVLLSDIAENPGPHKNRARAASLCKILSPPPPPPRKNEVRPKPNVSVRGHMELEPSLGVLLRVLPKETMGVNIGQNWAVVLWDGDEDPDIVKAGCIERTNGDPL